MFLSIKNICKRERICKVKEIKDLKLYKFENNILVVKSKKECEFMGGIGKKIKKNKPWIKIEGEEYKYEKNIEIIEIEGNEEYKGIIKEI
jgi:hypothetical protein